MQNANERPDTHPTVALTVTASAKTLKFKCTTTIKPLQATQPLIYAHGSHSDL